MKFRRLVTPPFTTINSLLSFTILELGTLTWEEGWPWVLESSAPWIATLYQEKLPCILWASSSWGWHSHLWELIRSLEWISIWKIGFAVMLCCWIFVKIEHNDHWALREQQCSFIFAGECKSVEIPLSLAHCWEASTTFKMCENNTFYDSERQIWRRSIIANWNLWVI